MLEPVQLPADRTIAVAAVAAAVAAATKISNDPTPPKITATPFVWRDPAMIPRREWLYGHHLIRKFVSLTVAPGAAGKSSLLIGDALALASGRDLIGTAVYGGTHRVWLWNLEDPRDEIERRVVATMQHNSIDPADIGDRLFIDSGRDNELCIARQEHNGFTILEPIVDALVAELQARQIDVLIVDPFVSSHQVSENDNGAIDAVAKAWGRVAERANCSIELVHHLRKIGGAEATAESARGAVALVAAARSCRVLNKMTKAEAEKAGVSTNRGYFRVEDDKNNLAPPVETADWFHVESVNLQNGDNVGVVVPWQWPNALDDVTVVDLVTVQQALDGKGYRSNAQSKEWAGIAVADVLGLDVADKAGKAKVASLLKIWIRSGALKVANLADANRIKRPIIEVGEWASIACTTSQGEVMQGVAGGAKGDCNTAPLQHPPYRGGVAGGGGAPRVSDEADENAQNWELEF